MFKSEPFTVLLVECVLPSNLEFEAALAAYLYSIRGRPLHINNAIPSDNEAEPNPRGYCRYSMPESKVAEAIETISNMALRHRIETYLCVLLPSQC